MKTIEQLQQEIEQLKMVVENWKLAAQTSHIALETSGKMVDTLQRLCDHQTEVIRDLRESIKQRVLDRLADGATIVSLPLAQMSDAELESIAFNANTPAETADEAMRELLRRSAA